MKLLWSLFALILYFAASLLFSYPFTTSEKAFFESYKFYDSEVRHSMIRFPQSLITISSHCLKRSGTRYYSRDCEAWKIYEGIDDRSLIKKVSEGPYAHRSTSEIVFALCKESGGVVYSEVNEYIRMGREIEIMDFCGYEDGSMASVRSILHFLQKKTL
ncbi:MAG: hypothetical protein H7A25_04625 [Leptospiraceae bacterium]|nr:hypothetical protein [Leptospiraceae bacterium]MCP5499161.1 hypothetical protein [Leptospiraceae bacterium]